MRRLAIALVLLGCASHSDPQLERRVSKIERDIAALQADNWWCINDGDGACSRTHADCQKQADFFNKHDGVDHCLARRIAYCGGSRSAECFGRLNECESSNNAAYNLDATTPIELCMGVE